MWTATDEVGVTFSDQSGFRGYSIFNIYYSCGKIRMSKGQPAKEITQNLKYKCQTIFENQLKMLESTKEIPSSLAVREIILETERCYQYNKDLEEVVVSYKRYLEKYGDSGAIDRVKTLKATEQDELVCAAAVTHYDTWTQRILIESLSLDRKIKYHFVHKAEQTLALLGIATVDYGAIRGVRGLTKASWDRIQKMRKLKTSEAAEGHPQLLN
eukprot:TRINITY_DN9117_c0_g1_i1.p1 TRINITY_DN9117_c0_g1~~TRINITY_DN9117_c0_g1_i1.p1  ORF type:complete len:213 (+),score=24.90 TRINITY_DN9117_c0_g1_i1:65-703(+)